LLRDVEAIESRTRRSAEVGKNSQLGGRPLRQNLTNRLVWVRNLVSHIEERRCSMFESRVLRRIFEASRDEVRGEWRRLPNEELYVLYGSPNFIWMLKSRRMRWTKRLARMEDRRGAYRVLVGRPDGKRSLEIPRYRRNYNIKMDLHEMGWGLGLDCSG